MVIYFILFIFIFIFIQYYNNINNRVEWFERYVINNIPGVERFGIYVNGDEGKLYLSDLSIRNNCRGKGFGTMVMESLVRFGEDVGMDIYCIPSSDTDEDERLMGFYSRFGFIVMDEYGDGVVRMVKKFNKS